MKKEIQTRIEFCTKEIKSEFKIEIITYRQAIDFLLPRHYSGRKPNITLAIGWFKNEKLIGVCSFGKPASPFLCVGICGKKWSKNVYELNRLCLDENEIDHPPLSLFVAACLRLVSAFNDWIIVSYSDMAMNHHGYIYQATNWIYCGKTIKRTDKYTEGNKHSRHYDKKYDGGLRKVRSSKHRYVFFCSRIRSLKKKWKLDLNYKVLPYPKGENHRYNLGDFLKPVIIKTTINKE